MTSSWLNAMRACQWQSAAVMICTLSMFLAGTVFAEPGGWEMRKNMPVEVPTNVITLGSTQADVELLLGNSRFGWSIGSLGRERFTYSDGTKVVFIHGRVISVMPSSLSQGNLETGYTLTLLGKQVTIDPAVLCGVQLDGQAGQLKREVEECFFFAPKYYYCDPTPRHDCVPHSVALPQKRMRHASVE